jgi:glycosyltransferase involved in cell wall biosynthesis
LVGHSNVHESPDSVPIAERDLSVALLTGAGDTPYAYGLTTALLAKGIFLDVIAGDDLERPEFRANTSVNFLNLRGSQKSAGVVHKVLRVSTYYARLIAYTLRARPAIFHILWNNKFETFDRTLLTLFYRTLGKKIVLTAHNVNAGRRDANDSLLNRVTLKIQYRLADHIFVHTEKMKAELIQEFSIPPSLITVIPFGINNAVPHTRLTGLEARRRLGIGPHERTILFFGTIAPYKGLDYLIDAFRRLESEGKDYRLVVAGRPRIGSERYWEGVHRTMQHLDQTRVVQ